MADSPIRPQADTAAHSSFAVQPDTTLLHHQVYLEKGEAGTPLPYMVRGDNVLTATLLLCLVLFVVGLARSGRVVLNQAKALFLTTQGDGAADVQTAATPFCLFLGLVDCLLLAVASFIFATDCITPSFSVDSQPLVVAVFMAAFAGYFLAKWMLYSFVNAIFFDAKKSLHWKSAFLFITAVEGVLMFPLALLQVYFDLEVQNALIYFGFVLFLNKILSFLKLRSIFFRQKSSSFHFFLYFCALEIAPLLAFAGVWLTIVNALKVNF